MATIWPSSVADYFSERYKTLWGPAVNLDGPHSDAVRAYFFENALHWLCEYHLDGLRLDATHYLFDESPRHFLAELSAIVHATITDRTVHLIAEDPRNLAFMVRPEAEGGWGLDALWSDDFHHDLRRYLVGDADGAFRDFRGSLDDLALTINRGWLFCGAYSIHRGYNRGTDPAGLDPSRFVFFIQNHDRIGNRALGERLNHQVSPATFRAASALLLATPQIPLLFMGQEWASSAPFLFFTDHAEPLGTLVKEGRRHEFRDYAAFADPETLKRIPDCQAESTFLACKLDWNERDREPHASILRLYRTLLHLRRTEPALQCEERGKFEATALDADTLVAPPRCRRCIVDLAGRSLEAFRNRSPGHSRRIIGSSLGADPDDRRSLLRSRAGRHTAPRRPHRPDSDHHLHKAPPRCSCGQGARRKCPQGKTDDIARRSTRPGMLPAGSSDRLSQRDIWVLCLSFLPLKV